MDKIYKITSNQGEIENLLDFDIPEGDVLDLSKSHVNLICQVANTADDARVGTEAVFNLAISVVSSGTETGRYVPAVGVVKNAIMSSQRQGRLEEIRDCNVLRVNQHNYDKTQGKRDAEQINSFMPSGGNNELGYGGISPMIQCTSLTATADTAVPARYEEKEVRIPLKSIFNLGSVQMLDTSRTGPLRVHLELDKSRLAVNNARDNFNLAWYDVGGGAAENGKVLPSNVAGAVTVVTLDPIRHAADAERECGFYVGMPVILKAGGTIDGTAIVAVAGTVQRRITYISYDNTQSRMKITLNASLGTISGSGVGMAGVVLLPMNATTPSFSLDRAEIVLRAKSGVSASDLPDSYNYTTYTSEHDNGGDTLTMKRQFEVEANAINCVLVPQANSNSLYGDQELAKYRVAVNNENMTNRDIFKHTSLYYNELSRGFLNQGKEIKSLTEGTQGINDATTARDTTVIYQPLPLTDKMKLVEFELEAKAGETIKDFVLFKEVTASF